MARRIEAENPRHSTPAGDAVEARFPAAPEIAGAPCVPDPPTACTRRYGAELALTRPRYLKGETNPCHAAHTCRTAAPRF